MSNRGLKNGDQLKCDNGHTYTLGFGNGFYTFSIVDEHGDIVNYAHDYFIMDCINADEDFYYELTVGMGMHGKLKKTRVLEWIQNGSLPLNMEHDPTLQQQLETTKGLVEQVDRTLSVIEELLEEAYKTKDYKLKQELVFNAKLTLQDGRKQLR